MSERIILFEWLTSELDKLAILYSNKSEEARDKISEKEHLNEKDIMYANIAQYYEGKVDAMNEIKKILESNKIKVDKY